MKAGKAIPSDIRDAIRKDYLLMDLTNEELAKKYNVHSNTVCNLARRENWNQLKELINLSKYIDLVLQKIFKTGKFKDRFSWDI